MTATLTHKIRLDPTFKQQSYFVKACGIARFAWNWGLAKWNEHYQSGIATNALQLKKEFNALKEKEFPWIYEVTKYACQQPFIFLDKAFQGFFKKKAHYPKFKKKGIRDSFYIGGDQVKVNSSQVKIPNLGWVRLFEPLRFTGKITGVTISRSASYWFVSVHVEINQILAQCKSQASVGVDLGIENLATLSDGKVKESLQPLKKNLKKLKRVQRRFSRKKKGSNNQKKLKSRLAKLHYRISNLRSDCLHKLTTELSTNYLNVVIEDLCISKMIRNKHLSRAIMDCGWYEFRRQMTYKAKMRGNQLFIADKWFASSKQCSCCGHCKEELPLKVRVYKCCKCSLEINRDLNSAINLRQLLNTVSSTEIQASGQEGSVIMLKTLLQPAWKKEELSRV